MQNFNYFYMEGTHRVLRTSFLWFIFHPPSLTSLLEL